MRDEDLERLRADSTLAAKLWGRTFSALGAMTYREKGEAAVTELWVRLLRQHQGEYYREGLRKLGIGDHEPPAVAAAKYHYFTNIIGGLAMEYVEESPKKVWIRYIAPMWTYAGVTMMAIPGSLRRKIFTAWHPRNGQLMGCPRLGWVSTKFIMEGEPCDEGYFLEYDRDLAPGDEFRFEVVTRTPEFVPEKAPRLDPTVWPEARILKARRNWSREYVRTTVDCLFQMFGEQTAYFLVRQVMRCLAIQYAHELKRDAGIEGNEADKIAGLLARLLEACGQSFTTERLDARRHRLTLASCLPFHDDAPEALRAAWFEFPAMAVRLLNGRVAITRTAASPAPREIWDLEDTGRWLW